MSIFTAAGIDPQPPFVSNGQGSAALDPALAPDPGSHCPITPADLQAARDRRRAMLDLGYDRTLAVHTPYSPHVAPNGRGKQPLTEVNNGEKQPWTKGHSRGRLKRVTPYSANTGLVLGGSTALTVLDIDPSKTATAADQVSFTLDLLQLIYTKCPELKAALLRRRDPASVLLLCSASQAMTKLKVAGERGAVELLGEGQQCLVDGWHPRSFDGPPVKWGWHNDRAPWNTPVAALPVIPSEGLAALMDHIGASGQLGPPVARPTTTATIVMGRRRRRMSAYPATARLNELFHCHNGLVMPAIRALVEEVGRAGEGRHDAVVAICGRLVYQGWPHQRAVDWLTPIVNQHFQDGDWTCEIERALSHARNRQNAQLAKEKSIVWSNSNV